MTIRFAAIGLNHNHIYGQVNCLLQAGAELAAFYAIEPDLIAEFTRHFPQAKLARSENEILEDQTIHLIASAAIPSERAPLGMRAMLHGKDFFSDKPGFTTLQQIHEAREIQRQTGRIYNVFFSERLGSPASVKALELIQAGAIGRVIHTTGFGPHRIGNYPRPDWFYHPQFFGGIINDLASHQIDQFMIFTGSNDAEIVMSQVANFNHPQHPELEDFGDMVISSQQATGYIRVDWFTPNGLNTWGDVRLFVQGTDGYIEARKNTDLEGRAGGNHLFVVDHSGTRYINCDDVPLPFGAQLLDDIRNRTESAIASEHCFRVSELALHAQLNARRLGSLGA